MVDWPEEDNWMVYSSFAEASQEAKRAASLFGDGISVRSLENNKWKVEFGGESARKLAQAMDDIEVESKARTERDAELDREYGADDDSQSRKSGLDFTYSDEVARSEEDGWPHD